MRYIRYAFLAALAVVLAVVAFANRELVTLHVLPEEMRNFIGISVPITLPLYVVIFLGIVAGILIGFFWEWMREAKHRSKAKRAEKAAVALSQEVKSLKAKQAKPGDDVLALLDTPR